MSRNCRVLFGDAHESSGVLCVQSSLGKRARPQKPPQMRSQKPQQMRSQKPQQRREPALRTSLPELRLHIVPELEFGTVCPAHRFFADWCHLTIHPPKENSRLILQSAPHFNRGLELI
eukprot:6203049-Pleurochrysis_carterae.AAC.3